MLVARTLKELSAAQAAFPPQPKVLGLVPTMGALHAGHVSLLRAARKESGIVAASIFVNPTQFNNSDDLARYPRESETDLAVLRDAGCDLVWLPSVDTMYPSKSSACITCDGPALGWEGDAREGHFGGVATIVVKLLNQLQPARAFFGEKDWQQLQVIRSVVEALFISVKIETVPTTRDPDGLAMSSRNRRLDGNDRRRAPSLYQNLLRAAHAITEGDVVSVVLDTACEDLALRGFSVDYFALVNGTTMHPISEPISGARLITAVRLGDVRLLDNIAVEPLE